MSHSSVNQTNNICRFRFALLAVLFSVLSACSSLQKDSDPGQTDKTEKQSSTSPADDATAQGSAEGESSDPAINSLLAYQGPDPMADIQINAEIKKGYSTVAKLSASKNYAQALVTLDGIKTKYPQLSGPDYQRARIFLLQQKLDEALEAVDLSLKNNSRNYYALNLKGVILREKGQFAEAKQAYLDAITAYPPYPNSHLNLGVLADIYLRDSGLALIQYQQYQALTGHADNKVKNWIIEIERRIKAGG